MGEPQGAGESGGDVMALKTYACYTRCERCGVYDRNAEWCTLCGKPKRAAQNLGGAGQTSASDTAQAGAIRDPARTVGRVAR